MRKREIKLLYYSDFHHHLDHLYRHKRTISYTKYALNRMKSDARERHFGRIKCKLTRKRIDYFYNFRKKWHRGPFLFNWIRFVSCGELEGQLPSNCHSTPTILRELWLFQNRIQFGQETALATKTPSNWHSAIRQLQSSNKFQWIRINSNIDEISINTIWHQYKYKETGKIAPLELTGEFRSLLI